MTETQSLPSRSTGRRALAPAAAVALVLATLLGSRLDAAETRPIAVRYVSSSAVYLDAGRAEGLAVGARLRVVR
ncbi:MAG TPA: hypothetical protein VI942_08990, partial [Thermoanaerobaculia bacterium]|nr:hypothetical protein [Thermoanaerobaculia bacterium]